MKKSTCEIRNTRLFDFSLIIWLFYDCLGYCYSYIVLITVIKNEIKDKSKKIRVYSFNFSTYWTVFVLLFQTLSFGYHWSPAQKVFVNNAQAQLMKV